MTTMTFPNHFLDAAGMNRGMRIHSHSAYPFMIGGRVMVLSGSHQFPSSWLAPIAPTGIGFVQMERKIICGRLTYKL
jgi:hypothetical protein